MGCLEQAKGTACVKHLRSEGCEVLCEHSAVIAESQMARTHRPLYKFSQAC